MRDVETAQTVYRAGVVADGGVVTGVVGAGVAVLPDMSPKRTLDFLESRAAIAEVGGQLAPTKLWETVKRSLERATLACDRVQPALAVCRVLDVDGRSRDSIARQIGEALTASTPKARAGVS